MARFSTLQNTALCSSINTHDAAIKTWIGNYSLNKLRTRIYCKEKQCYTIQLPVAFFSVLDSVQIGSTDDWQVTALRLMPNKEFQSKTCVLNIGMLNDLPSFVIKWNCETLITWATFVQPHVTGLVHPEYAHVLHNLHYPYKPPPLH